MPVLLWTYEVNGDTITWLGGSDCDAGVKGTYKFTLNNGGFTQVVVDDSCGPRRDAFDGVTYDAPGSDSGPFCELSPSGRRRTVFLLPCQGYTPLAARGCRSRSASHVGAPQA